MDRPIDAVVASACDHYVSELRLHRPATQLPRHRFRYPGREERSLELDLPNGVSRALELESERQGVELSGIVEHAVLLYMADLDLR
jgi:hypothetical protein